MLERLFMKGFKSFATGVTVEFSDSDITAIVGPNGSGKSNIVDAIRWVMGEQSPTALRGSKMADVIFSGSENRPAQNEAEVTLVLDNSEGLLSSEEEELTLTRRVDREGSSTYLINGDSCRLKDVRELLDDTGLNQEPYSVVGQNRVEAILQSSPDSLRGVFEEAAGISRHRRRKEEAERRLERTEQDLQRVEDLLSEINTRLEPLSTEAEKARKYKRIYEKMKSLEGSYLVASYEEKEEELKQLDKKRSNLKDKQSEVNDKLKENESRLEQLKKKRDDINQEAENVSSQLFQAKSRLQEIEKNLDVLEEREKNSRDRQKRLNKRKEETSERLRQVTSELDEMGEQQREDEEKAAENLSFQKEILSFRENILREKAIIKARRSKTGRVSSQNSRDQLTEDLAALSERAQGLKERKSELREDLKGIEDEREDIVRNREKLAAKYQKYKSSLSRLNAKIEEIDDRFEAIENSMENLQQQHRKCRDKYSRCRSRWQARRRMQNQARGYYSGVKAILQKADLEGIVGPVARLIEVESRFETAVAAVLGGRLQQIVVVNAASARRAINFLKENEEGRATFLPLDLISGKRLNPQGSNLTSHVGYISFAPEVIDYEDRIENIIDYLLGRVIIAENIKAAVDLSRRSDRNYRFVTLEGELVNPGGSMTGGTRRGEETVLLRRSREKRELANKAAGLREKMHHLRKDLKEKRAKKETILEKIEALQEYKTEIEESLSSIEDDLDRLSRRLKDLSLQKQKYNNQIKEKKQELDEIKTRKKSVRARLKRLEQRNRLEKSRLDLLKERQSEIESKEEELAHLLQDKRLRLTRLEEQIFSRENDISSLKDEKRDFQDKIDELARELGQIEEQLVNMKERRQKLLNRKKDNEEEIENLQERENKLKEELSACSSRCQRLEKQVKNFREEKEEIDDDLHSLKLKRGKITSRLDRITGRLQDKYSLSLEEAREEFSSAASEQNPRQRIQELEAELRELGDVNLGAIEEYERLKSRQEFLSEEKEDLQSARSKINDLICKLEDKMGEMFLETFEEVDEEFSRTFTRLFGGGSAELELTDPGNPLNTGVEINAQPPGNKLQKLSLLSGGEKALTAIALIFAFFEVKPSPIYVLDEIDSSLDDANLDMFARFIREYSSYSQFIVVTHRKRLMAVADTIYGVTMTEKGESRLVSLQFDQEIAQ